MTAQTALWSCPHSVRPDFKGPCASCAIALGAFDAAQIKRDVTPTSPPVIVIPPPAPLRGAAANAVRLAREKHVPFTPVETSEPIRDDECLVGGAAQILHRSASVVGRIHAPQIKHRLHKGVRVFKRSEVIAYGQTLAKRINDSTSAAPDAAANASPSASAHGAAGVTSSKRGVA